VAPAGPENCLARLGVHISPASGFPLAELPAAASIDRISIVDLSQNGYFPALNRKKVTSPLIKKTVYTISIIININNTLSPYEAHQNETTNLLMQYQLDTD
jgi:hypothetical protein